MSYCLARILEGNCPHTPCTLITVVATRRSEYLGFLTKEVQEWVRKVLPNTPLRRITAEILPKGEFAVVGWSDPGHLRRVKLANFPGIETRELKQDFGPHLRAHKNGFTFGQIVIPTLAVEVYSVPREWDKEEQGYTFLFLPDPSRPTEAQRRAEERKEFARGVHARLVERGLPPRLAARLMDAVGPSRAEKVLDWTESLVVTLGGDATEVVLEGLDHVPFGVQRSTEALRRLGAPQPPVRGGSELNRFIQGAKEIIGWVARPDR